MKRIYLLLTLGLALSAANANATAPSETCPAAGTSRDAKTGKATWLPCPTDTAFNNGKCCPIAAPPPDALSTVTIKDDTEFSTRLAGVEKLLGGLSDQVTGVSVQVTGVTEDGVENTTLHGKVDGLIIKLGELLTKLDGLKPTEDADPTPPDFSALQKALTDYLDGQFGQMDKDGLIGYLEAKFGKTAEGGLTAQITALQAEITILKANQGLSTGEVLFLTSILTALAAVILLLIFRSPMKLTKEQIEALIATASGNAANNVMQALRTELPRMLGNQQPG